MRTREFINPCTGSGFKHLFLHKETLRLFLNSVLPVEVAEVSEIRIRSLPTTPTEPRSPKAQKGTRATSTPPPIEGIRYEPSEELGLDMLMRIIRYDILCVSEDIDFLLWKCKEPTRHILYIVCTTIRHIFL